MRVVSIAWVVTLILAAGVAEAQSARGNRQAEKPPAADPTETSWSAEKIDQPPTRELKFELAEEPYAIRLTRPDPKLVAQEYVAIVRFLTPEPGIRPKSPQYARYSWRYELELLSSTQSAKILKTIPEDRARPAQLDFFTSREIDEGFLSFGDDSPGGEDREVRILAPSAEVAEKRAAAFVWLLDQGFSRRLQQQLWEQRTTSVMQWREASAGVEKSTKELAELGAELKRYEDFPADIRSALRVQRLQLEVEQAGIEARIAACEKLLVGAAGDTHQAVTNAKVAAEIELAGFQARRAKADEFIAKASEKMALQQRHVNAEREFNRHKIIRENTAEALASIDERLQAFQPVKLVNNKILIHPIEWTK